MRRLSVIMQCFFYIFSSFNFHIRFTEMWIYAGVTKQVGDALLLEGQQRTGRVVSIGIAPWGIVERNHELLGHNRDVPCHSISSPRWEMIRQSIHPRHRQWFQFYATAKSFHLYILSVYSLETICRSKLAVLNNRHAYFLLVDNGTQGKYGAELILRRKLEKYVSNLKLHPCKCVFWGRRGSADTPRMASFIHS